MKDFLGDLLHTYMYDLGIYLLFVWTIKESIYNIYDITIIIGVIVMTKSQIKEQERQESISYLKSMLNKDDTIHTQLCHVSQSGMTRHIKVRLIRDNIPLDLSFHTSRALDWAMAKDRFGDRNGIRVGGCGMDMGFHLVYTLSRELFDDGYYVKHEWL